MYDVIGDVHGSFDKLTGLLRRLGYRERLGTYRSRGHQAVFVGDVVDKGDEQIATLSLIRAMVDGGAARVVMGNHEFNAIAYATENPQSPGAFLRTHVGAKGAKNLGQHAAFLAEIPLGSRQHREAIKWFKSMPLWLEFDQFRVVHACWHQHSIEVLRDLRSGDGTFDDEFFDAANHGGTKEYDATKNTLKGPEISLVSYGQPRFKDVNGIIRKRARVRWWDSKATSLRDLTIIPEGLVTLDDRAYPELPNVDCADAREFRYDADGVPVFYGHYLRPGPPSVDGLRVACVDYATNESDGPLVAYRFDGERTLSNDQFVSFP